MSQQRFYRLCYSRFALRFFAVEPLRYYIYSRHPTAICTRTRNFQLFRLMPTNYAQRAVAARLEECRASFLCLFPIGLLRMCFVFFSKMWIFQITVIFIHMLINFSFYWRITTSEYLPLIYFYVMQRIIKFTIDLALTYLRRCACTVGIFVV